MFNLYEISASAAIDPNQLLIPTAARRFPALESKTKPKAEGEEEDAPTAAIIRRLMNFHLLTDRISIVDWLSEIREEPNSGVLQAKV